MSELHDLAASYALGALAPEQARAVEERIAEGDRDLERAIEEYQTTVASLTEQQVEPVEPPADLRSRLIERIGAAKHPAQEIVPGVFAVARDRGEWKETGVPGVQCKVLRFDAESQRVSALLRMEAGRTFPAHPHQDAEECLVLEGDLRCGETVLRPGDFQWAEAGSTHREQWTEQGCLVLITASARDFKLPA